MGADLYLGPTMRDRSARDIKPGRSPQYGAGRYSLVVGLNRRQLVDELFTAVELADLGQLNFGEPMLHVGVLLKHTNGPGDFVVVLSPVIF